MVIVDEVNTSWAHKLWTDLGGQCCCSPMPEVLLRYKDAIEIGPLKEHCHKLAVELYAHYQRNLTSASQYKLYTEGSQMKIVRVVTIL